MYRIFDSHVHIYPDKIAVKATQNINGFYGLELKAFDGTVKTLLEIGSSAGVEKYLVHSVSTSAKQVSSINNFIIGECEAHPDAFIGFATMHPDFEDPYSELERAKNAGLRGIKLHPDFQDFAISDTKMDTIYDAARSLDLPILFHTGDNRFRRSNPGHVPVILDRHPGLRVICAHFGGWSEWEDAEKCLKKGSVWVDTCSSMFWIPPEYARKLIDHYGSERVLFGSDYPMWNVNDEIRRMEELKLTDTQYRQIYSENLSCLLKL